LCIGTKTTSLAEPPDLWSGRAAVEWARRMQSSRRFRNDAEEHIVVAEVLDRLYSREIRQEVIHNIEAVQSHDGSRVYSHAG